ncbi:MAG: FkbM family methyltransferase, partial [Planktomarina sp.]
MREQVGRTPPFAMFQHDLIASRIIVDGFFERPYLEFLKTQVFPRLDSHEVCLDIGANIGNHSVFFADHFENVISFEPNPRTHDVLLANARLRPNIETHNIGLSDQAGEVEVSYDPRNI